MYKPELTEIFDEVGFTTLIGIIIYPLEPFDLRVSICPMYAVQRSS